MLDQVDEHESVVVLIDVSEHRNPLGCRDPLYIQMDHYGFYFLRWADIECLGKAFGIIPPLKPEQLGDQWNGGDWTSDLWAWAWAVVTLIEGLVGPTGYAISGGVVYPRGIWNWLD